MKDKQIINILMDMIWEDSDGEGDIAVARLINKGIPVNVIAEYYGTSKTAEFMQKARDYDLID